MNDSDRVVHDGSTLYYCLLGLDPVQRQGCVDRLALVRTLALTLCDVTEPQVAEKKIHWWHEELQRAAQSEARHPATTAVQSLLSENKALCEAALDILSVAADERFTPADSRSLFEERHQRHGIASLTLVAPEQSYSSLLNADSEVSQIQVRELAGLISQADRLRRLPFWLARGYAVFDRECYDQGELTPELLAAGLRTSAAATEGSSQDPTTQRKHFLTTRLHELRETLWTEMPRTLMPGAEVTDELRCYLVYAELRLRQLTLWEKKQPDFLTHYMTATPIRKYFQALRSRRRWR